MTERTLSAGVTATTLTYLHSCPLCRCSRLRHYCRVKSLFDEGLFIRYERCDGCGIVFRNPRLPDDARLDAYEHGELREAQKLINPKNKLHYEKILPTLEAFLPANSQRRFLDFGCGSGTFLEVADRGGFDVVGLELSRGLAELVEKTHGFEVFQGLIDDPGFAGRKFDLIVSTQVFEHLLDPKRALESLREHLDRPGLLLLEVPNLDHVRERLKRGSTMNDSHLFYFNAQSMSRMLRDCGFEVVRVEQGLRTFHIPALRWLPDAVHRSLGRLLSLAFIRTGLSVVARLA